MIFFPVEFKSNITEYKLFYDIYLNYNFIVLLKNHFVQCKYI